jgi:pimeloyl-ACP methyl ester carboxylesterase
VQPERTTIKVAGERLAVVMLRPDHATDGPPLLFLHEGLGCIALWKDFPAALCRSLDRQGIVYDRQGYGRSDPLERPRDPRYLHDEAYRVLPAVLDALDVARAILIGHSDGATIALLAAGAFPDRVAAIVCEAAHVFVEEITLAGIRAAGEAFAGGDLRRRLQRYHGEKTDATFAAWHDTWLSPAFRGWSIEAELPRVTCPALVLQGEDDEYGTPAQVAAIARGVSGPVDAALIPGCAHVPHHQARADVTARIERFLERCGVRERRT